MNLGTNNIGTVMGTFLHKNETTSKIVTNSFRLFWKLRELLMDTRGRSSYLRK